MSDQERIALVEELDRVGFILVVGCKTGRKELMPNFPAT
jgi:hypothetical protein